MRALNDMSKPLYARFMSSLVLSTLATCDATPGFGSHTGMTLPSSGLAIVELVVARRRAQRVLAHGDVAEVAAEVLERRASGRSCTSCVTPALNAS